MEEWAIHPELEEKRTKRGSQWTIYIRARGTTPGRASLTSKLIKEQGRCGKESCEESKVHVVGLVLAIMYSLRKGTELFGERAGQATMTELTQIDDFETYKHVHKHELSEQDRRDALESVIKVTEKRADGEGHRKIKSVWWLMGASRYLMRDMRSPMDHLQQPGQTV